MTLIPTLDLFSGIGGFSLALRGATRTVAYCDISPKSRAVLAAQAASRALDRAPIMNDVTTLTAATLRAAGVRERVRLITGGFPCQDISAMNPNGDGIRGTRSGLISEIFRLADELSVTGMVLENSPLIVTRGLDVVLRRLRSSGFRVAWGIFAAADVGAPHKRARWICVAVRDAHRSAATALLTALARLTPPTDAWAKGEATPRIMPRTAARGNGDTNARGALLGNSVVPQCVRHAACTLARALLDGSVSDNGQTVERLPPLRVPRTVTVDMRIPPNLLIPPHTQGRYQRRSWATPAREGWHQSRVGSHRVTDVLGNQILYDVATAAYARSHHADLTPRQPTFSSADLLFKRWVINPRFIEWLMGYPAGWTVAAAGRRRRMGRVPSPAR
jgi:DNA (cytosine-5)-methyltransferase 1